MMIRVVMVLVVLLVIVLAIVLFVKHASPYRRCGKCNGLGYWEGVRMRERCDQCGGSGRIRKSAP